MFTLVGRCSYSKNLRGTNRLEVLVAAVSTSGSRLAKCRFSCRACQVIESTEYVSPVQLFALNVHSPTKVHRFSTRTSVTSIDGMLHCTNRGVALAWAMSRSVTGTFTPKNLSESHLNPPLTKREKTHTTFISASRHESSERPNPTQGFSTLRICLPQARSIANISSARNLFLGFHARSFSAYAAVVLVPTNSTRLPYARSCLRHASSLGMRSGISRGEHSQLFHPSQS